MRGRSSRRAADLEAVADLAGRRHGIVSREELAALGMSRHAIRRWSERGYLRRIHNGVYAVGHDVLPVRGHWLAATLSLRRSALSHRSAAQLRGLADPRLPIHVTVPNGCGKSRRGVRVHQSLHLDADEIDRVEGIPTTSLPRTLLDVAALGAGDELENMAVRAQRKGLLGIEELWAYAETVHFRSGAPRLRELLERLDSRSLATRSGGERRLLALLERGGVRAPEVNAMIGPYEIDLVWRQERVAVELDGFAYHRDHRAFELDRRRGAYLAQAGYELVRLSYRMVRDEPEAVLASIKAVLARNARIP